jgi:GNAT superfamily N-acetyltransferase
MQFTIKKLDRLLLPAAMDCARTFFYESDFSTTLTPDPEKYEKLITSYVGTPDAAGILAVDDNGKVLGYAHIYRQNYYTKEWIGEMFQFYVRPETRGTQVARSIAKAVTQQFDECVTARDYIEAAPGLSDPSAVKLFCNLWRKFGFRDVGQTMQRGE